MTAITGSLPRPEPDGGRIERTGRADTAGGGRRAPRRSTEADAGGPADGFAPAAPNAPAGVDRRVATGPARSAAGSATGKPVPQSLSGLPAANPSGSPQPGDDRQPAISRALGPPAVDHPAIQAAAATAMGQTAPPSPQTASAAYRAVQDREQFPPPTGRRGIWI